MPYQSKPRGDTEYMEREALARKDPAFLFYSKDFLTGVLDLTMEERGQYITLLCLQHQKGRLSEKAIGLALGLSGLEKAQDVLQKFEIDEDGLYYNQRLEEETQARKEKAEKKAETSRLNGSKGGRPKTKKEPSENPAGFENETQRVLKNNTEKTQPVNVNVNEDVNVINDFKDLKISEAKKIIEHLNMVTGGYFDLMRGTTLFDIQARLKEGYTLDDFIHVIDVKHAEWGKDPKFVKHLNPKTLFCGEKFEKYVNQPVWADGRELSKTERAVVGVLTTPASEGKPIVPLEFCSDTGMLKPPLIEGAAL